MPKRLGVRGHSLAQVALTAYGGALALVVLIRNVHSARLWEARRATARARGQPRQTLVRQHNALRTAAADIVGCGCLRVFERGRDGGCVRLRRNGCSKAALSSVPPGLQAWLLLYPLYWNKDKRANAVPMGAATCCRYLKDGVERNMDYDYVVRSFGCSA